MRCPSIGSAMSFQKSVYSTSEGVVGVHEVRRPGDRSLLDVLSSGHQSTSLAHIAHVAVPPSFSAFRERASSIPVSLTVRRKPLDANASSPRALSFSHPHLHSDPHSNSHSRVSCSRYNNYYTNTNSHQTSIAYGHATSLSLDSPLPTPSLELSTVAPFPSTPDFADLGLLDFSENHSHYPQ